MINKSAENLHAAVAYVFDDATILVGGFGGAGHPADLLHVLIDQGARELTVINNNAGNHEATRRGRRHVPGLGSAQGVHSDGAQLQGRQPQTDLIPNTCRAAPGNLPIAQESSMYRPPSTNLPHGALRCSARAVTGGYERLGKMAERAHMIAD